MLRCYGYFACWSTLNCLRTILYRLMKVPTQLVLWSRWRMCFLFQRLKVPSTPWKPRQGRWIQLFSLFCCFSYYISKGHLGNDMVCTGFLMSWVSWGNRAVVANQLCWGKSDIIACHRIKNIDTWGLPSPRLPSPPYYIYASVLSSSSQCFIALRLALINSTDRMNYY